MSDRKGQANRDRFPKRKDNCGRTLCRVCGSITADNRQTFCGPRCLRDYFMQTDWQRVRAVIYARDGGVCMKCDRQVRRDNFQVDHIIPLAAGGAEWDLANLELSCPECNRQKGDRVEKEYTVLIE